MWTLLSSLDWRSVDRVVAWAGEKATTIDIYQVFADLLLKIIEGLLRTIALALNEQILDDICCEEHDENIDHVLAA